MGKKTTKSKRTYTRNTGARMTIVPAQGKQETPAQGTFKVLALAEIDATKNIRSAEASLQTKDGRDLVASVRKHGVIQPVIVVKGKDGKLILRAGYRRYAAVKKLAGEQKRTWENAKLPAMVYEVSEADAIEKALIENVHREDMNAFDKAKVIDQLIKLGTDQTRLAENLGMSQGYISQLLALLQMPASVQKAVKAERLPFTAARELSRLKDGALLAQAVDRIEKDGLSSRDDVAGVVNDLIRRAEEQSRAREQASADRERAKGGKPPVKGQEEERALSLVDKMRLAKMKVKSEGALRSLLMEWAGKVESARKPETRREYEYVLQGLQLAAGVEVE